jgi:hypothetical protein
MWTALLLMDKHRDTAKLGSQRYGEHWRKCAADTREAARSMGLTAARRRMEEIAEEYDRLAELAEQSVASKF